MTTIYRVSGPGNVSEDYRSRARAIARAKEIAEPEPSAAATVTAIETSGTRESRTQIWPTVGETYER